MKAYFHPSQDLHVPKTYFTRGQMRQPQEVPARTGHLLEGLRELGMPVLQPADQGAGPISRVHDLGYLRFLQTAHRRWMEMEDWGDEVMSNIFVRSPNALRGVLAEAARYLADGSCPVGERTWEAAYWSAQSALGAADALMAGDRSAYAVCRPPGHHARRDAAGGFCYLNNAAIAAEHLRGRFNRIAILDTDMHHGQGIQEIFYHRSDVLYVSIHGDPTNFYPVVSGFEDERGEGEGDGFNINLPMPHGASEEDFFGRLDEALAAIRLFQPDALVLALGFDIYRNDPQAKVSVSSEGFCRLGTHLRHLGLPTLVVQEGGYDLDTLGTNVQQFFRGLEG
ncbi:histone deacetylase family protein [Marinobacter lutaoensis]|jgi:acetoin utilization deacetylase AcuC-like enzyme|uniref:Acetylpolyamine amidohydrolase n=1 Tax=Marinobacter lutaoensis TaxID=135739 RepID=A0A1V2DS65_9GAMM|nr:histone deacetylase family protein [Marinobacter lutaoensis]MBE02346.1 histone deacetylase family protein [Marinobacter sp.]NVD35881.1 histone deacetylase family protein [Marinobacter lutaoensis]ONF43564.1 acetylpolyamine amidohydrolase [Marinobacter lutaoensis]|tara:strand:+ start:8429 stop:9442 length:1014 start_codon:yes stop_codon:yes gene_type:complete